MAPLGVLYYIENTAYKAEKALVTAKFVGVELEKKVLDVQKDLKQPELLLKSPTGKVPFLQTPDGCIFTSNAVARFVARCRAELFMYGRSFDDEGAIDTWLDFSTHELEVPLMTWVYPVLGLMEDVPKATADAQTDVKKALSVLEKQLAEGEYLLGSFLTVADIVLVCALKEGFARVFDPAFRKPFPKVVAWFERCCEMPQFKSVLGAVKLCATPEKPKVVLPAFAPPPRAADAKGKKDAGAKAQPNAKAKADAKPKAEAKAKAAAAPAAAAPAAGGGDADAKVQAVADEVRALKEKLKAEGLSGKKINDHEDVKRLVAQLQELKAQAASAPAPAPAPAAPAPAAPAAGGDVEAQVKAVGDEIRALKEKLKGEGLSGKKINEHDDVKRLVAQLTELKKQV